MKIFQVVILGYGVQITGGFDDHSICNVMAESGYERKMKKFSRSPFLYLRVWKIRLDFRIILNTIP